MGAGADDEVDEVVCALRVVDLVTLVKWLRSSMRKHKPNRSAPAVKEGEPTEFMGLLFDVVTAD